MRCKSHVLAWSLQHRVRYGSRPVGVSEKSHDRHLPCPSRRRFENSGEMPMGRRKPWTTAGCVNFSAIAARARTPPASRSPCRTRAWPRRTARSRLTTHSCVASLWVCMPFEWNARFSLSRIMSDVSGVQGRDQPDNIRAVSADRTHRKIASWLNKLVIPGWSAPSVCAEDAGALH